MTFEIHHYLHLVDPQIAAQLSEVLTILRDLKSQGAKAMKTLDELVAAVTAANTKTDSLITLVGGLKQQVADLLSGAALPAGLQAKVDAAFDAVTAEAAKVQTALDANVPTP